MLTIVVILDFSIFIDWRIRCFIYGHQKQVANHTLEIGTVAVVIVW
jgi:hypothetical protein